MNKIKRDQTINYYFRKQSPAVSLVGGKRSKDRSSTRREVWVNKKGKGKKSN